VYARGIQRVLSKRMLLASQTVLALASKAGVAKLKALRFDILQ
jgi:hypothetical protein